VYEVVNLTPFQTAGAALIDLTGEYVWVVIVKGTFRVEDNGEIEAAAAQQPVAHAPLYRGAPGSSSLRMDADLCPAHPGTDVTVDGHAYAPGGRPIASTDVSVRVGALQQTVRVHGDRVWTRGFAWLVASEATPFVRMPVVYERAFGGRARTNRDEDFPFPANPVGVGFHMVAPPEGSPLPNIEDPQHPARHWNDRPCPAGLGPIDRGWSPRRALAGTYDEQWKLHRAPLWPGDADCRFFSCAPAGLFSETPLRGGEPVVVEHMTPEALWAFTLPRFAIYVRTFVAGRAEHSRAQLDRVLLLPDDRQVVLTWRAVARCGNSPRKVNSSTVWAYRIQR
jgi:hypothetical protein